jgi:ABC-type lipoprotein export system ATPase subunit
MTIEFNLVIPEPIRSNYNPESEIWNQNFKLETGVEYNINAKSGKGKSTFTQIIYGIRKDYTGDVLIDNHPVKSFSNDELANLRQQHFSILFQDLRLFTDLSAKQNILVNAALEEDPPLHYMNEWASLLGIAHLLDRPAGLLSYGERQRVAIIRALIQPFDWILLDEPFSHLDLENTEIAYSLIKQRAIEQDAGIVLTTLGEDHFLTGEFKDL